MKYMNWSWAEYWDTPLSVRDTVIRIMHNEAINRRRK